MTMPFSTLLPTLPTLLPIRLPANQPHIRWMVRRDVDRVLAIEAAAASSPPAGVMAATAMTRGQLDVILRESQTIGYVAAVGGELVGHCLIRLHGTFIEIVRVAIDPQHRRQGVGRAFIDRLLAKLRSRMTEQSQKRTRLTAVVDGGNLPAQLWLKAMGFRGQLVGGDRIRFVRRKAE